MVQVQERSYHPETLRPHARDFCVKSITVTLIVTALIGLICGVIAYYVATSQASLDSFSSISLANSYFMMGGFSCILIASTVALSYFVKKSL